MILHNRYLPEAYIRALSEKFPGRELVSFPPDCIRESSVYRSIRSHPDIYICWLSAGVIVAAPSVFDWIRRKAGDLGLDLVKGFAEPGKKYPSTALYNVMSTGRMLFHKLSSTDSAVIAKAVELGLEMVDVPQGYTRCSCVYAGRHSLVSSDRKIVLSAMRYGMDTIYVDPQEILLPGHDHGFIGGASGLVSEAHVVFCGDLREHPQGEDIIRFYKKKGITVTCLDSLPLYDCGSLFFL